MLLQIQVVKLEYVDSEQIIKLNIKLLKSNCKEPGYNYLPEQV